MSENIDNSKQKEPGAQISIQDRISNLKSRIVSMIRSFIHENGKDLRRGEKYVEFKILALSGYKYTTELDAFCNKVSYFSEWPESKNLQIGCTGYNVQLNLFDFDLDMYLLVLMRLEDLQKFQPEEFETLEKEYDDLVHEISKELKSILKKCGGTILLGPYNPNKNIPGLIQKDAWVEGLREDGSGNIELLFSTGSDSNVESCNIEQSEMITLEEYYRIFSLLKVIHSNLIDNDYKDIIRWDYYEAVRNLNKSKVLLTALIRNRIFMGNGKVALEDCEDDEDEMNGSKADTIHVDEITSDDLDFTKHIKIHGTFGSQKDSVEIPLEDLSTDDLLLLAKSLVP